MMSVISGHDILEEMKFARRYGSLTHTLSDLRFIMYCYVYVHVMLYA